MKIFILVLLLVQSAGTFADSSIARRFAPVIYQGLGSNPDADEFTRVDFDGDWNAENNWDNMPLFPRPRTVYWDVMESEHHYFVTYSFFFPRDYASWCFWIHCHENDFEGMRVTVRKPDQILKVEGLAHNFKSEVLNPGAVEVSIESGGHGVHPLAFRAAEKKFKKFTPKDYELRPLGELWSKRDTNLFTGKFQYKGRWYPASFGGKKWILFGLGAAKPPWSWEIWRSDIEKGQWFLDPLKGSSEKMIKAFDEPSEIAKEN